MKNKMAAILMTAVMVIGLGACGGNTNAQISTKQGNSAKDLKATVSVNGSTTVQPLAEEIAQLLNKTYPNLEIEIQGTGSGTGIKSVSQGSCDIGMSSRELKDTETGIDTHVVAYDGIAAIVNPNNPVKNLTSQQLKDIFEGTIKNWKEVGGNDADIIVISREAGSGTRSAFEELLKLTKKDGDKEVSSLKEDALIAEGNGAIKASIASKENAVSYMSLGYLDDSVKAISIDDVECTVENIKAGTYKISRPLLLLTSGQISEGAQAFLDCFLSEEGQKIVSEKYITVK